jgi:hypothetical protein
MKNLHKKILTVLLVGAMHCGFAQYSPMGAGYYGTSFEALHAGYLEGFSIYTNAVSPDEVSIWLLGPYSSASACETAVNGANVEALNSATLLKSSQTFGSSSISISTDAQSYDANTYGINYSQTDPPNNKLTVSGNLEGMDLKKNKHYVLFFSVTKNGSNEYNTRVVVGGPQLSLMEIEDELDYLWRASQTERIPNLHKAGGAKVTVCHTSGNGAKELSVNANALQAHLDHGDTEGTCAIVSSMTVTVPATTFYLSPSTNQTGVAIPLDVALNISYKNKWRGNSNGDWSNPNNWSTGVLPSAANTVIVEAGYVAPVITGDLAVDVLVVESGATLEIDPAASLTVTDYLLNTGSIDGSVQLSGTTAQIAAEGTIGTLEVDNSMGAILSGDMVITDELVITSGSLDLDSNSLTVSTFSTSVTSGDVVSGDLLITDELVMDSGTLNLATEDLTITLLSDASKTAFIMPGSGEIVGDVTVERYIPADNGHHYLSTPLSNSIVDDFSDDWPLNLSAGYAYLYYYDESTTSWASPTLLSEPLAPGKGYTGWIAAGVTVDLTGTLNSGNTSVNITNGGGSESGWNFIGNPYPSSLDWDLVSSSGSFDPLVTSKATYVWNHDQASFGAYATYFDGIGANGGSEVIPVMQGFFIYTDADATLTFHDADRISTVGTFLRTNKSGSDPMIRLELGGEGYAVETVMRFKEGASDSYLTIEDALYFPSGSDVGVEFASQSSNNYELVINSLPLDQLTAVTSLYSTIGTNGVYTIEMIEATNFSSPLTVMLTDVKLGVTHDLNSGPYSFVGDINDNENRFELNTSIEESVIVEDHIDNHQEIFGYYHNSELHVRFNNALETSTPVSVYNSIGQNVLQTTFLEGSTQYTLPIGESVSNGVYIIKLANMDEVIKICAAK